MATPTSIQQSIYNMLEPEVADRFLEIQMKTGQSLTDTLNKAIKLYVDMHDIEQDNDIYLVSKIDGKTTHQVVDLEL